MRSIKKTDAKYNNMHTATHKKIDALRRAAGATERQIFFVQYIKIWNALGDFNDKTAAKCGEEKGMVFPMKEKIDRFMLGRYGNDQLNRLLIILVLVCCILSFLGSTVLHTGSQSVGITIGILALAYAYFRMFSRNIYKRSAENAAYLRVTSQLRQAVIRWKYKAKQYQTYHIYRCSSCSQKIRIPRGKGKIEITCPKCGNKFIKRS